MTWIADVVGQLNSLVWGPAMLVLILGTGLFLTIGLRLMPMLRLGYGFRQLWQGRSSKGEGDISPFNALMTSLSATIGTGNIAGVGTAIAVGGPGALFWMWATALVGMATKYAEALLAVKFRQVDPMGNHLGGPMFYIKNGLGRRWAWLGVLFALFGAAAGFGIGNMVQANSVADALQSSFSMPHWATGLLIAVLVGLVLIGGIQWIARVAGKLVPFMGIAYIGGGLLALSLNVEAIPASLALVFTHAFTPAAELGGFAGASVMVAIQMGVARGIFSNEAGLGSAPIAHAAAKTDNAVRQGTIAMLGTFIDTILVCTVTGLVILVSGEWSNLSAAYQNCLDQGGVMEGSLCRLGEEEFHRALTGASLSSAAYGSAFSNFGSLGHYIVSLGLALFAFTTILGWSVYGERCVEFLFGVKSILPFRILWVSAIPAGALVKLSFVWLIADTLNALMAIPNLIALLLLSPVVFQLTRQYFKNPGNFTRK